MAGIEVTEEPVLFFELAGDPRFAHLWDEMAHWNVEATREPEPWGLTGPTPLTDLMSELAARLTPQQVAETDRLVWAEYLFRINEGEVTDAGEGEQCEPSATVGGDDGPAGDADVADPAGGPAVVDEGDRSDPGDPDRS